MVPAINNNWRQCRRLQLASNLFPERYEKVGLSDIGILLNRWPFAVRTAKAYYAHLLFRRLYSKIRHDEI